MKRRAVLLLLIGLTSALHADMITLKNGETLEGVVVESSKEQIVLELRDKKRVTLPQSQIARIEKGKPVWVEYEERKAKLKEGDAKGAWALAEWCRQKDLEAETWEGYEKTIAIDPDHAQARAALGYVQKGKEWVFPFDEKKPGVVDRDATVKDHKVAYLMHIPAGYAPKRRQPLLIVLNPKGVTHRDLLDHVLRAGESKDLLIAAPELNPDAGGQEVLDILPEIKREFHVDPRRVYLFGHMHGGAAAGNLAMQHPDLFAAAALGAPYGGTGVFPKKPNSASFMLIVGANDEENIGPARELRQQFERLKYDFVYKEFNGGKTVTPGPYVREAVLWMKTKKKPVGP